MMVEDESGISFKLRGTGWGSRRALYGLYGGGELNNGSIGCEAPSLTGPGGDNTGWGASPPPNPTTAPATGAPVNASNQMPLSPGKILLKQILEIELAEELVIIIFVGWMKKS